MEKNFTPYRPYICPRNVYIMPEDPEEQEKDPVIAVSDYRTQEQLKLIDRETIRYIIQKPRNKGDLRPIRLGDRGDYLTVIVQGDPE